MVAVLSGVLLVSVGAVVSTIEKTPLLTAELVKVFLQAKALMVVEVATLIAVAKVVPVVQVGVALQAGTVTPSVVKQIRAPVVVLLKVTLWVLP